LHDVLKEEDPPIGVPDAGEPTRAFRTVRRRYLSDQESGALGLQGEHLVLLLERQKLTAAGRPDLAARIRHVSAIEGDGAGYDIHSFFPDGRSKFIEVKTTRGPKNAEFWISPNEIAFSAEHAASYELCRVFEYDPIANSGSCYSVQGDIGQFFTFTATEFRARLASNAPAITGCQDRAGE
jgi:Protein NO VEIN, C-terminal